MSLPVYRYEPNAEKKKTHNRRKSSTRSLHQKLVVKKYSEIFLGKSSTRSLHQRLVVEINSKNISGKRAAQEIQKHVVKKIFSKYFWEKSSWLGEISSHINLPPRS